MVKLKCQMIKKLINIKLKNMDIEIAYIIAGTMIFVGFIVGGGIIYSELQKIADAIKKKKND